MLEPSLTGEATCAPRETSSTSLSSPPEPGVSVLSESPECSEHLTFPSPLFNLECSCTVRADLPSERTRGRYVLHVPVTSATSPDR